MPPADKNSPNPKCESCDKAKLPEKGAPKESTREASEIGYSIHLDISPKHPKTLNDNYTRIIQFIDERSKYIMVEPCRKKSDAFEIVKEKVREIERTISPKKISIIRSDGAKELVISKKLKKFYKKIGIRIKFSAPHSQHQNGLIERNVRTINEGTRAMMLRACMPEYDWYYAKSYFVYLRNHFHIPEGLECPPSEMWEGINSPLIPEGAFGSKVLAKILYKRKKSGIPNEEKKSRKCVFLGIDEFCKAYIVRPYDGRRSC